MSAAAFDTLSAARDLEAAGIDRNHAEAIAKVVHHGDERAATKADLDTAITGLKADLDTAITGLKAATKADLYTAIVSLKADMLKVAIGIAIGVVIANATLTAVLVFGALQLLQP